MSNWVYMGYSGLTWGLVLCGVALPVLAVAQWKLRTRLRAYWLMVTGALIIYSCGVFALTLLPLPQYAQVVIFDVDDLMTNTFGGLIGAICAVVWIAARKRPEAPFIPPWASTQRDEVPSTTSVDEVFARLTEGCDDVRDKATRDQELVLSGR